MLLFIDCIKTRKVTELFFSRNWFIINDEEAHRSDKTY
jgi:hypothetical protein